ncbi:HTH_38 domain-containing protein [Trichonephila clavipes]|nr:HTH_38 domain-containing protein [Trichonephila clavipes]
MVKRVSVSIDRCKPAFFLNTEDLQLPQTKNETPATVEPNATASTPTQPSTRSGRKVHLPTRMPLRRNRRQYEQLKDFDSRIGLREAGWSNRRIGRHLGRIDMVVARCWQQWITEGRVYRRGGSDRPRNTNDREDRAIRRVATSAPTTSLASIQRHLPPSRHPKCHQEKP